MVNRAEYFNTLYEGNDDPWSYKERWYEERKRRICLALFLKSHYQHILELGCGNGMLSELLAQCCSKLTAIDANIRAVDLAQRRLKNCSHVSVQQLKLPEQYPHEKYDLIIVSEIAYYLETLELIQLIQLIRNSLTDDGMVLCCHWRYDIEKFELNGEKVHQLISKNIYLNHYLKLNDHDFIIDLWTKQNLSLADQEGLR